MKATTEPPAPPTAKYHCAQCAKDFPTAQHLGAHNRYTHPRKKKRGGLKINAIKRGPYNKRSSNGVLTAPIRGLNPAPPIPEPTGVPRVVFCPSCGCGHTVVVPPMTQMSNVLERRTPL